MAGSWEHAFCCTFYDGAQIYVRNHERLRVPGGNNRGGGKPRYFCGMMGLPRFVPPCIDPWGGMRWTRE